MKNLFNTVELAHYRVLEDIEHTFLKKGQEHTAYLVKSFGVEYILIGCSVLDPQYFDFCLWFRYLERVFEKDM